LAAAILPNRFFNTNYTLTMAVGCSELLILDDPLCNVFEQPHRTETVAFNSECDKNL
jgi:hypothetical protein